MHRKWRTLGSSRLDGDLVLTADNPRHKVYTDRHPATRVLCAFAGGAALTLSLPPYSLWPLGTIGCGLYFIAVSSTSPTRRCVMSAIVGVTWFFGGLTFIAQFSVIGLIAVVVVETAFLSLGALLLANQSASAIVFGSMIGLSEFARAHWPFGGLPLAGIALGQVAGPLVAIGRIGGPVGIDVAVGLLGAGSADLVWECVKHRRRRNSATAPGPLDARRRHFDVVAVATAFALAVLGAAAPSGGPVVRTIRIGIVQGGGPRGTSQIEVPSVAALYRTLTASLALPVGLQLVLWPENTVPLPSHGLSSAEGSAVEGEARALQTTLLAGITQPVAGHNFLNELLAFSVRGSVLARFEKVHAVPFGEYVPFRSFVGHFANLSAVPLDAVTGDGNGAIMVGAVHLAVLMSYETFFADRGRSGVRAGGQLLVVATNTASYASPQVPSQELAASELQSIEEGRTLIQAATTGISAVIGPDGVVERSIGLGRSGTIVANVELRNDPTIYGSIGDTPLLVLLTAVVVASIVGSFRSRRRKSRGELSR